MRQEIFKELESLVCKLYGFKNSSLVDEVRKCLNLSLYEKEKKSRNVQFLPLYQGNLWLDIRKAEHFATIFKCASICYQCILIHNYNLDEIRISHIRGKILFFLMTSLKCCSTWMKMGWDVKVMIKMTTKMKILFLVQLTLKKVTEY